MRNFILLIALIFIFNFSNAQDKIIKEVSLQTGYSFYLMTNSLVQLKNVNKEDLWFPQFAYIMVTVNPTIYNSIW